MVQNLRNSVFGQINISFYKKDSCLNLMLYSSSIRSNQIKLLHGPSGSWTQIRMLANTCTYLSLSPISRSNAESRTPID